MKSTPLLLLAAVIVGAVLRGYQAGESFWVDELHTSWSVSGSLAEVHERAVIGNQSPLYFWLVWFFHFLPTPPEIALRLPSLIAGSVLPVALFWLTRQLLSLQTDEQGIEALPRRAPENEPLDNAAPLLAAWLVVVDPLAVFYAQEARPYALLQLLAVVHLGLLCAVVKQGHRWRRIAWISTGAILVHLHYTAGLILLAEAVAIGLLGGFGSVPKQRREMLLHRTADLLLMLLLITPAIPGILAVAERRTNWEAFVEPPTLDDLIALFPWKTAAVALVVLNTWRRVIPQSAVIVLTCWLFVPLLFAWSTTEWKIAPLFFSRYLIAAWPASLIAAAMCVRFARTENVRSALIGILLAIAVRNSGMIRNYREEGRLFPGRNEDWRTLVASLNEELEISPAPVLVRSALIEADELPQRRDSLFRDYCLLPVRGSYRLNCPDDQLFPLTTTDPGQITPEVREVIIKRGEVWLINRSTRPAIRRLLINQLQSSVGPEYEAAAAAPQEFRGVYLQRIELKRREKT